MTSEKFFLGEPVDFKGKFQIYPPKMGDVIINDKFSIYYGLLTQTQEDIEDLYEEHKMDDKDLITPFQFILGSIYENKELERLFIEAFEFFVHKTLTIIPDKGLIVIGNLEEELNKITSIDELVILKEEDYFDFQNYIRAACGEDLVERLPENETLLSKKIRRNNYKRRKIVNKQKEGISLTTSLAAICCMGLGINPLNIGELSYASYKKLIGMYQQKEAYELDIRSLMAGADPKKVKPKYWIREDSDLINVEI